MRAQLTVTLALMMGFSALHAQDVKALVQAYEAQADQIAAKLLFAEFAKHADRIHHLAFTFCVQIDTQGRPHTVKITSKTHNAFIEDTARRTLAAAKFPPIPKKVTLALGETLLAIQETLMPMFQHDGSNQALERTAARCAFTFQMTKKLSVKAMCALGGGRSACSR